MKKALLLMVFFSFTALASGALETAAIEREDRCIQVGLNKN